MNSQKRNQMIYTDAFNYIKENSIGLTDEILEEYLRCERLTTMDEVFKIVVRYVYDWYKPKRMVIEYDSENMSVIEDLLHNYDYNYFLESYSKNPNKLYEDLIRGLTFKDPKSSFTDKVIKIYVNVLCSMAVYLSKFKDTQDMYLYFDKFKTPDQKYTLVTEIQKESHSSKFHDEAWGAKLAENWIKDIGMQDYCKTDTHVTKFILGLKLTDKKTDKESFKTFIQVAEDAKLLYASANAFKLDRIVFIMGSKCYYNHPNIKFTGSLDDFIEKELEKLK